MIYKQTKENVAKFKEAVASSKSVAETLKKIGWETWGGDRYRFKKWKKDLSVSTNHFTGQLWSKGKTSLSDKRISANKNPFSENSHTSRDQIKKLIIAEKFIEYKCAFCGITNEWNNKKLVLDLDHINGVNNDHRLENLRFLCPNCHSQTPTFCGRNKKTNKLSDDEILKLASNATTIRQALILCGLTTGKNYNRLKKLFPHLIKKKQIIQSSLFINGENVQVINKKGKSIYNGINKSHEWKAKVASKNFERRKVRNRPTKDELSVLVETMSMVNIGKKYGVTDNSIKKWCKSYNITPKPRGYWAKIYGKIK